MPQLLTLPSRRANSIRARSGRRTVILRVPPELDLLAAGLHEIETVFNGDTDSPRPGNEVGGPLEQGQRLLINRRGLLIRCAGPLCHQQKHKGTDSSFYQRFLQYFHSNLKLIPESEHPLNSRYCIQLNSAAGAAGMMKKRKSH